MAEYILDILKSNLSVIFSWGFNSPVALENGLKFYVNGFKHKGAVVINYNEGADLFDIEILNTENQVVEIINGVYFDQLIVVIDNHVEYVENYDEAVKREYSLTDNKENDNN